ncbi:MAG TPA: FAD-dependent oxidoreductase [Polyangia bacterium]|nr:FAD-dependent oxidoreductase [Polyangia bacterium]
MVPFRSERNFALGIPGFHFADLFDPAQLAALDVRFRADLAAVEPALAERFEAYRAGTLTLPKPDESELLIAVARGLSAFVARLFSAEPSRAALLDQAAREAAVFRWKEFVLRRAAKKYPASAWPAGAATVEKAALLRAEAQALAAAAFPELVAGGDEELTVARVTGALLDIEEPYRKLAEGQTTDPVPAAVSDRLEQIAVRLRGSIAADLGGVRALLDTLERFAAVHRFDAEARAPIAGWVSLHAPHALEFEHLVPLRRPSERLANLMEGPAEHRRRRDGFALTDQRMSPRQIANEVDYCLYCHDREKDSCSHGLRDKQGALKKNPLGVPLKGCPLDERISEMHVLKKGGDSLGALALICIDNPMLPGTGHRICNDCMKGCVFQKQEPVNIPQTETATLTDVLAMPHGFEIYSLLARWNPLNRRRPHALPYNGKNVLVVGLGPAGYTLSHHLVNEGFGVVGVDGLKIEPLPADLLGADAWPPRALERFEDIESPLEDRILGGFGGVAEYGITVRWDKNFLTTIHLALARRATFRAYGGVRFGGTLDADDAFHLGFDHVALAAGAGKPTIIDMENNLIRGVRKASDFLMALQLTGGFKKDSLANLQVRLPAVVIGGGLTGIDTTTEVAAYYPVQVEKFLERWETLAGDSGGDAGGDDALLAMYDAEEAEVAREFLAHGRAVRAERVRAAAAGEEPDFAPLIDAWGGVSLVYRRTMQDSPAYRLNHEEISKFFEEGVRFVEKLSPIRCVADVHGAVEAVVFEKLADQNGMLAPTGEHITLPVRSLFVAAGTQPNITYEREREGSFEIDPKARAFRSFKAVRDGSGKLALVPPAAGEVGFFTSMNRGGKLVSFYGDNHPAYAGSVVKAMSSAKHGYPHVVALFEPELRALRPEDQPARDAAWRALGAKLDHELRATVVKVNRLTATIVEVVVRAPAAARQFEPGQFFRLQNYESLAPALPASDRAHGPSRLQMEGMALTGAWVDEKEGLLSMIVLEMGGSSRLCAALAPGEPVVVMGPTGTPTEIPAQQSVVLCGGGLGNAVLFSIARAMRDAGSRVLYFAGYKRKDDIYKVEEIETATDQVIWSVDEGELPETHRPQDLVFRGNIVQAMDAYARGALGEVVIPLSSCSRIIAIGSNGMMAAIQRARHALLAPHLHPEHVAIASINSPMQCMMKEICAQCLQKHVDPVTGKEVVVFSCSNQDQLQDRVDWKNLGARLRQNTVQEKLTDRWVRHILARHPLALV